MSFASIFESFDPTPYQTAPLLPLQTLVVLSGALSARMPVDAPEYIVKSEQAMRATAEEADQAMLVRLRETNEQTLAGDLALDNAVDGLWGLGRERLLGWGRYERPGLEFLRDDPDFAASFAQLRERATRARVLTHKLLGDGNLELLAKAYPEQAKQMATILRLIATDNHTDEFSELAGPELLPILLRCQREYEAMVDRRTDTRSRTDLRTVRAALRRRIVNYSTLVLTLLDESVPGSRAVVETALEPMVSLRPTRAAELESGAVEPGSDTDQPGDGDPIE